MGNNPSTSKSSQHHGPGAHHGQYESSRSVRRENKNPIAAHNQRVAAPPEPSLAQAHGTIPNKLNSNRPTSFQGARSGAIASSSSTSSPEKTVNVKPKAEFDRDEPSKPVAVPNAHQSPHSPRFHFADVFEAAAPLHSSVQDMSYLTRPPRLPLPIEEEVHTPGSPIISPADIGEPLENLDGIDSESLSRHLSTLSNNSLEDEDAEELRVDKTRPTVPTRLEWRHGGGKVYVTGTIFQWNRKTRLQPVEGQPGVFAATIPILPGTHHIRFLVDGQMQTSPSMPTTVDFGNNLVNYIEVNPDDISTEARTPAAESNHPNEAEDTATTAQYSGLHGTEEPRKDRDVEPAHLFSHEIPSYLSDFDQPEDTREYQMAWAAIETLPNPPSLPGFLAKPLLNAATLIKDDNSVLNMPNHTVLNHLLTCSIKNNILAVSATTRYKSKYVTTIVYKPTSAEASS